MDSKYDFGWALDQLRNGNKVQREGWNGKGMFLFLVHGSISHISQVKRRPHIDIRTANGEIVPWVASQSDLLENDWALVP